MGHCGNIGMLREDIPIVASPESIVIMKGMQDSGQDIDVAKLEIAQVITVI